MFGPSRVGHSRARTRLFGGDRHSAAPEARGVAQVEEQVKVTKKYVDVLREQNKLDLDHLEQMVRNYARVREVNAALAAMPRRNPSLLCCPQ